jgi:DNA (cytosine-5)-methyltransferase 1
MTSPHSTPQKANSISSLVGFPVKTCQLQASKKALEKVQEVDYSLKSLDLLGKYDLNSSSLKTLETCSRTPKGKPTKKFSKKLPKQGLMLSGVLYQQKMWEPATVENACGLLPTPLASTKIEQKVPFKQGGTPLLAALLPLPTPTARDYKDSGPNTNYEKAAKKKRRAGVLNHTHSTLTGEGTYLNPPFVEEMMGFPIGWTDLSA